MIALTQGFAIPLFDRTQHHSSIPTIFATAVARSGGPEPAPNRAAAKPARLRFTVDGCKHDGSLAISPSDGVYRDDFSIFNAVQRCSACRASVVGHASSEQPTRRSLRGLYHRGVQTLCCPGVLDTGGNARRECRRSAARSRKGAMGLMQIMPQTWSELRARYELGADPYDPRDNILAGAAYICELYQRFGAPGFLAAYNAGPGRYEHHLATNRPLPDETQEYVARLSPTVEGKQTGGKIAAVAKPSTLVGSPLFVVRIASNSTVDRLSPMRGQTADQVVVPLSIYRRSCRSRAICSCALPARLDRNDPDRALSQSVVGHRMF